MATKPRTRLGLEQLDARLTPTVTAFTFTLPDGTIGTGIFDYDDALIDIDDSFQDLEFTDWSISLAGETFTDDDGYLDFGTVFLEYGEVINTAFGGFTTSQTPGYAYEYVFVDGGQVEVDVAGSGQPENASIEYMNVDFADLIFEQPDGTPGGVTFATNWDTLDPEQEEQYISVPISGVYFDGVLYTSADLAVYVSVGFTAGSMTEFSFSLPAKDGQPAIDVIFANGQITITDNLNSTVYCQAPAAAKVESVVLDFNAIANNAAYKIALDVTYETIAVGARVEVERREASNLAIPANATPGEIVETIHDALNAKGYLVDIRGNNKLVIKSDGKTNLRELNIILYKNVDAQGEPIPDGTLNGPTRSSGTLPVKVNGTLLPQPNP